MSLRCRLGFHDEKGVYRLLYTPEPAAFPFMIGGTWSPPRLVYFNIGPMTHHRLIGWQCRRCGKRRGL